MEIFFSAERLFILCRNIPEIIRRKNICIWVRKWPKPAVAMDPGFSICRTPIQTLGASVQKSVFTHSHWWYRLFLWSGNTPNQTLHTSNWKQFGVQYLLEGPLTSNPWISASSPGSHLLCHPCTVVCVIVTFLADTGCVAPSRAAGRWRLISACKC